MHPRSSRGEGGTCATMASRGSLLSLSASSSDASRRHRTLKWPNHLAYAKLGARRGDIIGRQGAGSPYVRGYQAPNERMHHVTGEAWAAVSVVRACAVRIIEIEIEIVPPSRTGRLFTDSRA